MKPMPISVRVVRKNLIVTQTIEVSQQASDLITWSRLSDDGRVVPGAWEKSNSDSDYNWADWNASLLVGSSEKPPVSLGDTGRAAVAPAIEYLLCTVCTAWPRPFSLHWSPIFSQILSNPGCPMKPYQKYLSLKSTTQYRWSSCVMASKPACLLSLTDHIGISIYLATKIIFQMIIVSN